MKNRVFKTFKEASSYAKDAAQNTNGIVKVERKGDDFLVTEYDKNIAPSVRQKPNNNFGINTPYTQRAIPDSPISIQPIAISPTALNVNTQPIRSDEVNNIKNINNTINSSDNKVCLVCHGDGGAKGDCYKCGGSGWV